ncbi:dienelactone hydrolase family protein [Altericroceibacterium xinjiangense]|uniref:dienelactone hydrolase family protein n=1 Tax=Altericroceibacterium xinjiangense TaxID=762261 RepID=UPI000F7E7958|nr:dienelactone hydrolase family protein [Altericroceibacterium xinjiangense]
MCDETDLAEWNRPKGGMGLNRRQFAALGTVAGLGATLSGCATAMDAEAPGGLTEHMVSIQTGAGTMDAFFVHPASGRHPAVIVWPDIAGLRPAFQNMARRLAAQGYSVLVTNPYYRDLPAPQFADFSDFRDKDGFQAVGPWRGKLTADTITQDARALVSWLDAQGPVDTSKGIGTQGYCMGGPFTVWTAAAAPNRVRAAASFHGGGLVGDEPTAPVHLFAETPNTRYLFAIAQNDDGRAPNDKERLREAAAQANVPVVIEVFPADHGWTVPDSPVYAPEQAERAWAMLLDLYRTAL